MQIEPSTTASQSPATKTSASAGGPRPFFGLRPLGGLRPPSSLARVSAAGGDAHSRPAEPPSQPEVKDDQASTPLRVGEEDPFALDGLFVRWEGAAKPMRVSPSAWAAVFPPDRARVRRIAGRLFLQNHEPDEAVAKAMLEIEMEDWTSGPDAERLNALAPFFPGGGRNPGTGLPIKPAADAVLSVATTARLRWREILEDPEPSKAAFLNRSWRAAVGTCLVCGQRAGAGEQRYRGGGLPVGGDAIHSTCRHQMARIGPAYVELVIQEARRIEASPPPPPAWPEPDPNLDPDDPSTWGTVDEPKVSGGGLGTSPS